ncbi:hypothetical protein THAOC_36649 [Thalassiosira oceanica]|uniref:Uncharacterized protein n=1 Tax=Thalassiosira oceanica TaxID=159749 RepID=K0QZ68_THAOC|nr:hypothetical protein THAOC_36649 [Thalassiosira oceanica]|eukprot:EJK44783.1 hypothetical protein THAOC_36649 [Thalassiosira oceanica]
MKRTTIAATTIAFNFGLAEGFAPCGRRRGDDILSQSASIQSSAASDPRPGDRPGGVPCRTREPTAHGGRRRRRQRAMVGGLRAQRRRAGDFRHPGLSHPLHQVRRRRQAVARRREAARLPGLGRHLPEADPGHRRAHGLLREVQQQRAQGRTRAVPGGHGAVRGRARQGRVVRQRQLEERDRLHERRDGVDQPDRLVAVAHGGTAAGGPEGAVPDRGGRDTHHRGGAPQQHRAVADGRGGHGCGPEVPPGPARRVVRPGNVLGARHGQDEDRLGPARLERPRYSQPRRRHRPDRARYGRAGRKDNPRRVPVRPAHGGRRPVPRRRLRRRERAQDVRPDGHRLPLGEGVDPQQPSPVQGGRGDDRRGANGPVVVRAGPREVRGWDARDRPGGRTRRGRRLPELDRDGADTRLRGRDRVVPAAEAGGGRRRHGPGSRARRGARRPLRLRYRFGPPLGPLDVPRRGGSGDPGGPSLLPAPPQGAGAQPLGPGESVLLQHEGGRGQVRGGPGGHAAVLRVAREGGRGGRGRRRRRCVRAAFLIRDVILRVVYAK